MPLTFLYLAMLAIWLFVAVLVWLAAGFMLLWKPASKASKPLCFAMAGTFPFVFAYQIAAAPFVAVLVFAGWALVRAMEPSKPGFTENPAVIIVSIFSFFAAFGIVLAMSLAGFYEGWRTGWAFAKGRRFQEVMLEGPTARIVKRLNSKSSRRGPAIR